MICPEFPIESFFLKESYVLYPIECNLSVGKQAIPASQYRLAKDIGVPAMRVSYVVNGKRPVTAELALRLGRYFGQSPRYWLNLQSRYDMDTAEDTLSDQVKKQVRPLAAAAVS